MTVSYAVEPWDPGYGLAYSADTADEPAAASSAELDLDLELPAGQWQPVDPDPFGHVPGTVLFLDGVRRIDARVWVQGASPRPAPGIAVSLAAGIVCCGAGAARIADVVVERDLITAAPDATDLVTRSARYTVRRARDERLEELSLTMQQRLAFAEASLAAQFRSAHPDADDLLVIDGPLRGRSHLDRAIGYVKTHHTTYLPDPQAAVVASLKPGQRSPAFTMGTSWRRHSWYLQLASAPGVPWSGVVRLECSADLPRDRVVELANLTARVLPPLASSPHKDPRAPQNLVPIGGLERQLKHLLGDQHILYRALRAAAAPGANSQALPWRSLLCHNCWLRNLPRGWSAGPPFPGRAAIENPCRGASEPREWCTAGPVAAAAARRRGAVAGGSCRPVGAERPDGQQRGTREYPHAPSQDDPDARGNPGPACEGMRRADRGLSRQFARRACCHLSGTRAASGHRWGRAAGTTRAATELRRPGRRTRRAQRARGSGP